MRKALLILGLLSFALPAGAGFKVKLVKPKKPDQFQARTTVAGVTYGADLLLEGKDQKDYFYKELAPSNLIAIRLAVFNGGKEDVVLPLEELQLIGPDGKQIAPVGPDTVAQAVLQGLVVAAEVKDRRPVTVSPGVRSGDPRIDRTDPRYDPSLDPTDPSYDPNEPRNRRYGRGGVYGYPGVDVVLSPGQGGGGDLSEFEKKLVEKDFRDKSHSTEPILNSLNRDKFLYFSFPRGAAASGRFTLRLPSNRSIPQEVILKF